MGLFCLRFVNGIGLFCFGIDDCCGVVGVDVIMGFCDFVDDFYDLFDGWTTFFCGF